MATVKLTLFHAERDILLEVNVSAADVQRASIDTAFATQLFNRVLNDQPYTSTSADLANQSEEEYLDTEYTGYSNSETLKTESEVSLYRWSTPCVFLLLESFKSMEKEFNSGRKSQKKVWEKLAQKMNLKGHDVTGQQCSSKLRSLKKTYKSVKEHNTQSGNDKRDWQYLDLMEDIFSKKAWCDPVAVASSTGLSKKQSDRNDSVGGSDSCCSLKTNKTPLVNLLGKRLQQKAEHEEQKNKRHKERMEMDQKLLNVLEKLVNK